MRAYAASARRSTGMVDQPSWSGYRPGMGIHINIAEAKARLSELVAAAVRGEEVVLDRAGKPQVRLVAVAEASAAETARRSEKRKSALGMYAHLVGDRSIDIRSLKPTEAELNERYDRKFGAAD